MRAPVRSILLLSLPLSGCFQSTGPLPGREVADEAPLERACPVPRDLHGRVLETTSGSAYHWSATDACVPVTIEPSLEGRLELVADAVDAWNAVPCSTLELCAPRVTQRTIRDPDLSGAIHVTDAPSPEPGLDTTLQTVVTVDGDSGRILGVAIHVDRALSWDRLVSSYVHALAHAVGLDDFERTASARDPWSSAERPQPDDAQLLCRVYGTPPLCPADGDDAPF